MKRVILIIAIVLAIQSVTGTAMGYELMKSPEGKTIKWENPTIVMTMDSVSMPAGSLRNAHAQHAMWTWNQVKGSKVEFLYRMEAAPNVLNHNDGKNTIDVISSRNFEIGVLATTFGTYYVSSGYTAERDVAFNAGVNWEYQTHMDCATDGQVSFTDVAIHEFGHVIGLDHEDDVPCIMNTYYSSQSLGAGRMIVPNADDTRGARALYLRGWDLPLRPELSAGNNKKTSKTMNTPITVPSTGKTGGKVYLDYAVHNRGNFVALNAGLGFFLSKNSTISTKDRLIKDLSLGSVSSGHVVQGRASLVIPADLAPGDYYLGYFADHEDKLLEPSNNDNTSNFCMAEIRISDATAPAVTIQKPASGSVFGPGTAQVQWKATDNDSVKKVDLDFSTDGGTSWKDLANGLPGSGTFNWAIPASLNSSNLRIRAIASDPSGNTATEKSSRFTVDQKGPNLTAYFASDLYLRKYFDLVLFSDEGLPANPTGFLKAGGEESSIGLQRVSKEENQFRASLDLTPGVQYWLELSASDYAGNHNNITRNLVAGSIGAGAIQKLTLGKFALGSGSESAKETGELLLLTDGRQSEGQIMIGSDGQVEWTGLDPVLNIWPTGEFAQSYELTLRVSNSPEGSRDLTPVFLKTGDKGDSIPIEGTWDSENGELSCLVDSGGEYRLGWMDKDMSSNLPALTSLNQNHPNPFNPETTIQFSMSRSGPVSLQVFDIRGQLIQTLVNGQLGSGIHQVVWNGRDRQGGNVASGTYFYRLATDKFVQTRKMLLLK